MQAIVVLSLMQMVMPVYGKHLGPAPIDEHVSVPSHPAMYHNNPLGYVSHEVPQGYSGNHDPQSVPKGREFYRRSAEKQPSRCLFPGTWSVVSF
jgi:hypothetical protein